MKWHYPFLLTPCAAQQGGCVERIVAAGDAGYEERYGAIRALGTQLGAADVERLMGFLRNDALGGFAVTEAESWTLRNDVADKLLAQRRLSAAEHRLGVA